MQPQRATVMSALFTLLQGVTNFNFTSQRFVLWTDLDANSQMPALCLWEPGEQYTWPAEKLAKVVLEVRAIIYLSATQDITAPAPIQSMDALLDAMDAALAPSSGYDVQMGRQTLGNLVYSCRIEGEIIKASGDLDGISALIVPMKIVVPQRVI